MAIHEQGYRHYPGSRAPHGRAWIVIASTGVRTLFTRRAFLGLLLLGWLPFLIQAIGIYASATVPQARFLAPGPQTFRAFLERQSLFVFFMAIYAGAGLIANDRRANALQIYLSKPLTRAEYIGGKLSILATCLLLVTWVPAMALLLTQVLLTGSVAFLASNLSLVPAITLFAFFQAVALSTIVLALSSLSNSSRLVGMSYAAIVIFGHALYGVLSFVTDRSVAWVSLSANLTQIGNAIFGVPHGYGTPWPVSLLAVLVLVIASAVVLARRVQGVEIVT
jgi:ABC-2 type transport system permease protein